MNTSAQISHSTPALTEANRLMTICNACRYCEGLCAVFPAMEKRRIFLDADLNYLANLCHSCGACYVDCQFAPPHEFAVNMPQNLAVVRRQSYEFYAWPSALAPLLARNGLAVSLIVGFSVALFLLGFIAWHDPSALWAVYTGPGAFYQLMPHNTMIALFGAAFFYTVVAVLMSARNFWRDTHQPTDDSVQSGNVWQAVKDAATLRYLDGGGAGCYSKNEKPDNRRRLFHHMTLYGFLLCFAATATATLYHYLLGLEAPYAWYDLPVVLGTIGGLALVIGPVGLYRIGRTRDPALRDESATEMETAFLALLLLTALTGLLLLVLRTTPAMAVLLALHLGLVFGFFLTIPYSKFMHGIYRFLALVRYAGEASRYP